MEPVHGTWLSTACRLTSRPPFPSGRPCASSFVFVDSLRSNSKSGNGALSAGLARPEEWLLFLLPFVVALHCGLQDWSWVSISPTSSTVEYLTKGSVDSRRDSRATRCNQLAPMLCGMVESIVSKQIAKLTAQVLLQPLPCAIARALMRTAVTMVWRFRTYLVCWCSTCERIMHSTK